MGGGGDAQRRWGWRTGESDRGPSDQKYNLRRRPRLEPSGGKALKRRTTSYERIHELADWKRIGLHKKYADATMVRARSSRSSSAPVAAARIFFLLVRVPSRLTRPPRPSPRPPSRAP